MASYEADYGSSATGHAGIVGYNAAGELGVFNANSRTVDWSSMKKFFTVKLAGGKTYQAKQTFMRYQGG